MTRLHEDWLKTLENEIPAYEKELLCKTGMDFVGIAAASNGISSDTLRENSHLLIAVVPVTSGKGVIGKFANAVSAILSHTGFRVFITEATDVDGIYEAYTNNAELVFMADDRRYMGFRLDRRRISDNNAATARGFVTALAAMCPQSLSEKKVLVLGCGVVGQFAAAYLFEKNASPVFYDKNPAAQDACKYMGFPFLRGMPDIAGYQYILDATSEGGWLSCEMLHCNVRISAPGVPLSLNLEALELHRKHLVHDLLHIGTLTMLGELCSGTNSKRTLKP